MRKEEKSDSNKTQKDILSDIEKITQKNFFWASEKPEVSQQILEKFSDDVKNYLGFLDQDGSLEHSEEGRFYKIKLKTFLEQLDRLAKNIFRNREVFKDTEQTENKDKINKYRKLVKKAIHSDSIGLPFDHKRIAKYGKSLIDKFNKPLDEATLLGFELEPMLFGINHKSPMQNETGAKDKAKIKPAFSGKISRYQAFIVVIQERIKSKFRDGDGDYRVKNIKTALENFFRKNGLAEEKNTDISEDEKLTKLINSIVLDIKKKDGLGWVLARTDIPKSLNSEPRNGIQYILEKVDEEYEDLLELDGQDDSVTRKCSQILQDALDTRGIEFVTKSSSRTEGSKKETSHSSGISGISRFSSIGPITKSVGGGVPPLNTPVSTPPETPLTVSQVLPGPVEGSSISDGLGFVDPNNKFPGSLFNRPRTASSPLFSPVSGSGSSKGTQIDHESKSQSAPKTYSDVRYDAFIAAIDLIKDRFTKGSAMLEEVNEVSMRFFAKHLPMDQESKLTGNQKLEKLIFGIITDIQYGIDSFVEPYRFGKGYENRSGLGFLLLSLSIPKKIEHHDGRIELLKQNGIQFILEEVDALYDQKYQKFLKHHPEEGGRIHKKCSKIFQDSLEKAHIIYKEPSQGSSSHSQESRPASPPRSTGVDSRPSSPARSAGVGSRPSTPSRLVSSSSPNSDSTSPSPIRPGSRS